MKMSPQLLVEDEETEKVPVPKSVSLAKIGLNYLKLEFKAMFAVLKLTMRDTLTILKHIFSPKSVDNGIRSQAAWFHLKPKKPNGAAILLCHGFGSSPEAFKDIAPMLQRKGYYVRAIRISGHGTTPGHLAQTNGTHWFSSVVWHYKETRKSYDDIYFLGHSLGGTLGLLLSTVYPIRGAIAIAAPIKLNIPPARLARHVSWFVKYWPRSKRRKKIIRETGHLTYDKSPLYATAAVFEVGNVLRKRSDKLKIPVLYIRCGLDNRSFQNQDNIMVEYFQDTEVETRVAENSTHTFFLDKELDLVMKWVNQWLNEKRLIYSTPENAG